ncbi:MAG: hypothetical protein JWN46_3984, partial [Acidimicrobiales bacterium]|nr:hypothetical protein [Acidimicrobiales bacterium]
MLVELSIVEQRYQAVLAVQRDGHLVTEVAKALGVSRQTEHVWLRRYTLKRASSLDPRRTSRMPARGAEERQEGSGGTAPTGRCVRMSVGFGAVEGPWPLVGRDAELHVLDGHVRAGRSVVLVGAPGVGKTRLAQELVVRRRGAGAVWLAATRSSQAIPFGVIPVSAAPPSTAGAFSSALRGMQDLVESATRGPAIVVDNAHLVDDASAAVLHRLTASGVPVLCVLADDEPPADAIVAMWRDGHAERVELAPLSKDETRALVEVVLGGPCRPITLQLFWDACLGNVLYLREIVRAIADTDVLRLVEGRWQLDALPATISSGRLIELVGPRVRRLEPSVRRVVELVAIAEPVAVDLLDGLATSSDVAAAEEAGLVDLIDETDGTVARVSHPMYADVVRRMTPAARRRAACGRLADALAERGLGRVDALLRCALWRLDAGGEADVEMLLDASWAASMAQDHEGAIRLSRAALARTPPQERARVRLADAFYRNGRYDAALEVIEGASPQSNRDRAETAVLQAKACVGLDRLDEAEAVLDASAAQLREPTYVAWVGGYHAMIRVARGYPLEAVERAEPLTQAPDVGARGRIAAWSALATGLAFAGRFDAVVAAVASGRAEHGDATEDARTTLNWVGPVLWISAWLDGDLPAAARWADIYGQQGLEHHDPEYAATGATARGWVLLLQGHVAAAIGAFEEAIGLGHTPEFPGRDSLTAAGLGWARAWAGDAAGAQRALDAADPGRGAQWFVPCLGMGRAWAAAAAGDEAGAHDELRRVATDARARGQGPYEVHAWYGLARLGQATEATIRLEQLAAAVDGRFVRLATEHAEALAARDGHRLDAVALALADA